MHWTHVEKLNSFYRVAGCLQQSADVMKSMQQLVKVPEMQKTMMEMSKEMMKVQYGQQQVATEEESDC